MKSLCLKEIVHNINGQIIGGSSDLQIRKVATRLQRLEENTLFFDMWSRKTPDLTIPNQHHSFAIVTTQPQKFAKLHGKSSIIRVPDIMKAYWDFVSYYRSLFDLPVIGITGTCGKTTTKDMIRHILESRYKVQATKRSLNDSVYNLKYLTEIDDSTEAAVIEMGVAYPGDLLRCCKYFKPQIGVITKIGVDHLMGCKTLEGYIKAKGEILEGMGYTGTLIINADDDNIKKIDLNPFQGKIVSFGFNRQADFRFTHIRYYKNGMKFFLHHKGWIYPMLVPGLGKHNVYNALAAIAAVHSLGFDIYQAGQLLRSFEHLESHVQVREGYNGCTVLDDTWSTNPTSIEAALEVLNALRRRKKTVMVLGFIDELGEHSAYYHALVGEKIAELGANLLVTVGPEAEAIAKGAIKKGMNPEKVISCQGQKEVFEVIAPHLDKHTVILVKTSMHVSAKGLMKQILETE